MPGAARLLAVSGGFLGPSAQARRIRRILALAGHPVRAGWPVSRDAIAAWGHAPRAGRAEWLARRSGAAIWRIEDGFIRSIHPGRLRGEPPAGLLLDRSGIHFDPSRPSDLEILLTTHPLDDPGLLARARLCMDRMAALDLSKYNTHDPALPLPAPGYVLVVDQVAQDASIRRGGLDGALPDNIFARMLDTARAENPGARIVIKAHPETAGGARAGHFAPAPDLTLLCGPVSPRGLLDGASAVYTVSSQLGFEAILAGHRPRVFGLPFYAGWGLSHDEIPHPRRGRALSVEQLFAAAMLLYPLWYDPLRDRLCPLEEVIDQFDARLRVFRADRRGHVAVGMRLWKRGHLQAFFGSERAVRFARPDRAPALAARSGRGLIGWAGAVAPDFPGWRVEDGFLRSRGLGAALVPPLSLVADDLGIYYDPHRESRLERLIVAPLPPGGAARAEALRATLVAAGVSKYNLGGGLPPALAGLRADGRRLVLVPGQVEDDASIRLGTGAGAEAVRTNRALLIAARQANPGAAVIYKPHPDIEAGLRNGAVPDADRIADLVLQGGDPAALLAVVDEVWTMTSGLGFEALLRGVPVVTLGAPFYAGWGLTRDLGTIPARRLALPRPGLTQLIHAALIAYPRYLDPATGLPCPAERALDLLSGPDLPRPPHLRILGRIQGVLSSYTWLWR